MSEQPIRVTAGIVERDGRILVARRREGVPRGGLWEFPGGKVETGESDEAALARELQEELGVRVAVGEPVGEIAWSYPDVRIVLAGYRCAIADGVPVAGEHAEVRWVPIADLATLQWCDADMPFVEALVKGDRSLYGSGRA